MGALNQEVSELTKGLHHMIHILQAHVSFHHFSVPFPSHPCGVQMTSNVPQASNSGMPFNHASTFHLHNDPGSHNTHQSAPAAGHWSCSGTGEKESHQRPQSCSPPANYCPSLSANSSPKSGPCHGSESTTAHLWSSPSLLSISPGFHGGSPGLPSHAGHDDNRPLGACSTTISQSQPTLCLQPPSDSDEYSCLLSSPPTGMSTHSLLDTSLSSYSNPSKASNEAMCVLMSTSPSLIQDTSIFQIKDSHSSAHPVSSSPPTLTCQPFGSSVDSESLQSDVLESHLPLGDPSAVEHTSLECLLGNRSSLESRDSESASSRRSSIGVQTQSTEQSWCLDLTD